MSADKRRRTFDDANDTSVTVPPSRPPLKKRFTGSFNIQPVVSTSVEPEPPTPVQPKLAEFSVNNLLAHLHGYTDSCYREIWMIILKMNYYNTCAQSR